jgi:hypothetical protein
MELPLTKKARWTFVHFFELMLVALSIQPSPSFAGSSASCSPLLYNFTITSSGKCPESNNNTNVGISNLACSIIADDHSTNTVVQNITSHHFFETGSSLSDLVTYELNANDDDPFMDGDNILFKSKQSTTLTPSSIGMLMHGVRLDGVHVTFSFAVEYSNVYDVLPFQQDYSIGWLQFVSVKYNFFDFLNLSSS